MRSFARRSPERLTLFERLLTRGVELKRDGFDDVDGFAEVRRNDRREGSRTIRRSSLSETSMSVCTLAPRFSSSSITYFLRLLCTMGKTNARVDPPSMRAMFPA